MSVWILLIGLLGVQDKAADLPAPGTAPATPTAPTPIPTPTPTPASKPNATPSAGAVAPEPIPVQPVYDAPAQEEITPTTSSVRSPSANLDVPMGSAAPKTLPDQMTVMPNAMLDWPHAQLCPVGSDVQLFENGEWQTPVSAELALLDEIWRNKLRPLTAPLLELRQVGGCKSNPRWVLRSSDRPSRWSTMSTGRMQLTIRFPADVQPDKMEVTLDGKPLDLRLQLSESGFATVDLPCLGLGRHVIQGRFLAFEHWSALSSPIHVEIRKPRRPEIEAVADGQGALIPIKGRVHIGADRIRLRLAHVEPQGEVFAYINGEQISRATLDHDCCLSLELRSHIPPGNHRLTVRSTACGGACSITSDSSRVVYLHYAGTPQDHVFVTVPTLAPSHANAISARSTPSVRADGADAKAAAAKKGADAKAAAAKKAADAKAAAAKKAADAKAAAAKKAADAKAAAAKKAADAKAAAANKAADAKATEPTAPKPMAAPQTADGASESSNSNREVIKTALATIQALAEGGLEPGGEASMEAITKIEAVSAVVKEMLERTPDDALEDVQLLGTADGLRANIFESMVKLNRLALRYRGVQLLDTTAKASNGSDAGATNNGASDGAVGDDAYQKHLELMQGLIQLQVLLAALPDSCKSCKGKSAPPASRSIPLINLAPQFNTPAAASNETTYTFTSPATFPRRGFGLRGESHDMEGLVIYEGMKLTVNHATGQYTVRFRTSSTPFHGVLSLQLLVKTNTGAWHTLTLAPIGLSPGDHCDRPFERKVEGHSVRLEHCEQIEQIKRKGVVRYSPGHAYSNSSALAGR